MIISIDEFKKLVEKEWAFIKNGPNTIDEKELNRVASFFTAPDYKKSKSINLDKFIDNKHFVK